MVGGGGWWSKVIFMSNPTFVVLSWLELWLSWGCDNFLIQIFANNQGLDLFQCPVGHFGAPRWEYSGFFNDILVDVWLFFIATNSPAIWNQSISFPLFFPAIKKGSIDFPIFVQIIQPSGSCPLVFHISFQPLGRALLIFHFSVWSIQPSGSWPLVFHFSFQPLWRALLIFHFLHELSSLQEAVH